MISEMRVWLYISWHHPGKCLKHCSYTWLHMRQILGLGFVSMTDQDSVFLTAGWLAGLKGHRIRWRWLTDRWQKDRSCQNVATAVMNWQIGVWAEFAKSISHWWSVGHGNLIIVTKPYFWLRFKTKQLFWKTVSCLWDGLKPVWIWFKIGFDKTQISIKQHHMTMNATGSVNTFVSMNAAESVNTAAECRCVCDRYR